MRKQDERILTNLVSLEHVAYDIRGPVLEEAMRMRANGEKILRLNTGNPAEFGFTAPDEVIHDLIMNARDSEGYSDSKGIFSARKAIMQYCQLKKFPNVDIDDIYLGNGVSELIVMSMQGLFGQWRRGLGAYARLSSLDSSCQSSWRKCRSLYL